MEKNNTTHTVQIRDFTFWPEDIEINCGETIEWLIKNNISEYSRVYNDDEKFFILEIGDLGIESDMLKKGQKFSCTFETKGTYSIVCLNYPRLKQIVKVQDPNAELEEEKSCEDTSKIRDSTNDDSWDLDYQNLDDSFGENDLEEDFCEFPSENLIEMMAEKQDFLQITNVLEKMSKGISRTSIIQSFPNQFDKKRRRSRPTSKADSISKSLQPSSPTNKSTVSINYNMTPINENFEKTTSEDEFEDFQQISNRKLDAIVVNQLSQISQEIDNELSISKENSLRNSKNLEKSLELQNNYKKQDMIEILEIDNSFDMIDEDRLQEVNMKYNFSSAKKKDRSNDNIDCISKCLENLQKMIVSTEVAQDSKKDAFSSVDSQINFVKDDEKYFYENYTDYSKKDLRNFSKKVGKKLTNTENIALNSLKSRYDVAAFLIGEVSQKPEDDLKLGKLEVDQDSTSDNLDSSKSFLNYNDIYRKSSIDQVSNPTLSIDQVFMGQYFNENYLLNSISEGKGNDLDIMSNFYPETNNLNQSNNMTMEDQNKVDSADYLSVDPSYISFNKNSKLLEDLSVNQDSRAMPNLLDEINVDTANKSSSKLLEDLAVHSETKSRHSVKMRLDSMTDAKDKSHLNIQDELDVTNKKPNFFQQVPNTKTSNHGYKSLQDDQV